jgi:hypothetical protein
MKKTKSNFTPFIFHKLERERVREKGEQIVGETRENKRGKEEWESQFQGGNWDQPRGGKKWGRREEGEE